MGHWKASAIGDEQQPVPGGGGSGVHAACMGGPQEEAWGMQSWYHREVAQGDVQAVACGVVAVG